MPPNCDVGRRWLALGIFREPLMKEDAMHANEAIPELDQSASGELKVPVDLLSECLAVVRHMEVDEKMSPGQSPGHSHHKPGVWNDLNGVELSGKPCEWCATWARFREATFAANQARATQLDRFREFTLSQCPQPDLVDLREYPGHELGLVEQRRFLNPAVERDWKLWQAATKSSLG
jgi:hypothetical protein